MPDVSLTENFHPPRLIPALVEGFNAIAGRIFIILFPIGIDLLLWFGPLVRIKDMVFPVFKNTIDFSVPGLEEEAVDLLSTSLELWESFLERLNLLASLRTLPVGIPSLLVGIGPLRNPIGKPVIIELLSLTNAIGLVFLLVIAGLFFGSIYYELIARAVSGDKKIFRLKFFQHTFLQTALLTGMVFLAAIILGAPMLCILSTITFLLPSLGSFPFTAAVLLLFWILMPLVFSGHGIFIQDLKALESIKTSARIVRRMMTPVSLFLFVILMLGIGLNSLWMTPSEDSWMLLVGIFGHGFISSGLLAASFVFYRDGINWFQATLPTPIDEPESRIP